MKTNFDNDYSYMKLSKYFILFIEKTCERLNLNLYYNPNEQKFIISDYDLHKDDSYTYYKNKQQTLKEQQKNIHNYNWKSKKIIFFDKEEPYEQNNGEMYFPDHYQSNHDIEFKLNTTNYQKLLLCVLKNPNLANNSYYIKDIFLTPIIDIFFPSKTLNTDPMLNLLIVEHLQNKYLFEQITSHNNNLKSLIKQQEDDYKIKFFTLFPPTKNKHFKNFIFDTVNDQNSLEKIFNHHISFKKFLSKNIDDNIVEKTQSLHLFKSFFNIKKLNTIYHTTFDETELKVCFVSILNHSQVKQNLEEKGITLHSVFYDYSTECIVCFIENQSELNIKDIEKFFIDMFNHFEPVSSNIDGINDKTINKITTFFNYYFLEKTSTPTQPFVNILTPFQSKDKDLKI